MADSFQTTPENRDATIAKSRADASQGKRESALQRTEREEKEQREARWAREKAEAERVGKLRERAEGELRAEEAQVREAKVAERSRPDWSRQRA